MKGSHFLGKWLLGDGWGFDRFIFQFSFVNMYRSGGSDYFIQVLFQIEVVCKLRNRIIIRVTEVDCEKETGLGNRSRRSTAQTVRGRVRRLFFHVGIRIVVLALSPLHNV